MWGFRLYYRDGMFCIFEEIESGNMLYKITIENHWKALGFLIFITLAILVFYLVKFNVINSNSFIQNGLIIYYLINFLPVLYLHNEYYYNNKGITIEIDSYAGKFNKIVRTEKTGKVETYGLDDLNKIEIYMPPNLYNGRSVRYMPFEDYHYARIYTNSGKEIIITCLMVRNVEDAIKKITGVPIERKIRLFASIEIENNWKIN